MSQGFALTLQDVIKLLGNSDYTLIAYHVRPNSKIYSSVTIYYPNEGYVFYTQSLSTELQGDNVQTCLDTNDLISTIKIIVPAQIDLVVKNEGYPLNQKAEDGVKIELNSLKVWPGFGCLQMPYPPTTFQDGQYR